MADLVGHPWMQGPHAAHGEVKEEFALRHQRVIQARLAEAEKNKIERQQHATHRGARRGDKVGDKVYLELGEVEETKDTPSHEKVLQACKFNFVEGKNTQFFSTYETTYVFSKLVEYLRDH